MTQRIAFPAGIGCLPIAGILGGVVGGIMLRGAANTSPPSSAGPDRFFGWLLVLIAVITVLWLLRQRRRRAANTRGLADLSAALAHHIGRPPEYVITGPNGDFAVIAFVIEKRLYLGNAATPFDPARLFSPADIRRWEVKKHEAFDSDGKLRSTTHYVEIEVAAVDMAVVRLVTGTESDAFRVREILNQAFA